MTGSVAVLAARTCLRTVSGIITIFAVWLSRFVLFTWARALVTCMAAETAITCEDISIATKTSTLYHLPQSAVHSLWKWPGL